MAPRLVHQGNVYEQSEDGYYVDENGLAIDRNEDDYYVDEDGNPVDPNDVSVGFDHEPWGIEDQLRGDEPPDTYAPGEADPSLVNPNADLGVIDWNTIQATNQAAVKDLDEGQQLPFWQAQGYVLIGADHDQAWRALVERANGYSMYEDCDGSKYPTGTLVMSRKGRLTDPGKLTIYGSPDQQATRLAIGEWSKKKIDFA